MDSCNDDDLIVFPIKSIKASCRENEEEYHEKNVLDTSYESQWFCKKKGSFITLEPDYSVDYLHEKGINYIDISFGLGQSRQYYFIAQQSQDTIHFKNLTSNTLMSSGRTDALESFYIGEEIRPKYIRVIFNGNNKDDFNRVFTLQLSYQKMQEIGKSYTYNNPKT